MPRCEPISVQSRNAYVGAVERSIALGQINYFAEVAFRRANGLFTQQAKELALAISEEVPKL